MFESTPLWGRIFNLSFWVTVFVALFIYGISLAHAEFEPMTSTPDILLGDSSTSDHVLSHRARWIYLKNDCTQDVYFDLRGRPQTSNYPLRLKSGESFTARMFLKTVGASPGAGASGCTITIIPAR